MLFGTKKEAELFMKYNGDEIQEKHGYRPLRAYFCQGCGGWHVTSQPRDEYDFAPVEKLLAESSGGKARFPDGESEPYNMFVLKSRKELYKALVKAGTEPDDARLLDATCAAKGYYKLAKSEPDRSYMSDARACVDMLCGKLAERFGESVSEMREADCERDAEAARKRCLTYTAVMHGFPKYRDESLNLKRTADSVWKSLAEKAEKHAAETRGERALKKLGEYRAAAEESLTRGDVDRTGRLVHFATLLIKKNAADPKIHTAVGRYVDEFMKLGEAVEKMKEKQSWKEDQERSTAV